MNKVFFILSSFCLLLCSCSEQYNINGDSTVSTLDGRMLYLKALSDNDNPKSLDSCEVVHGKFNFIGMLDSTCMGELYMDNESVMPVVIENANLNIRINNMEQRVTGGSLNNKLYRFLEQKNQIESQITELSNQEARQILSGKNPDKIHARFSSRADKLYAKIEQMETKFIVENHDNVLGPTFFMMLCSQYPYPIVTSQIQQIIRNTSSQFRHIPFVRDYMKAAESNMHYIQQTSNKQVGRN
jgi:hypothetical protein